MPEPDYRTYLGYGGRGSEVTNLERFPGPKNGTLFASEFEGLVFDTAPKPSYSAKPLAANRLGITQPGTILGSLFGSFGIGKKPVEYSPSGYSLGTELAAHNPSADNPYVPMTDGQTPRSSAPYPVAIDGPMLALERGKQMLASVLDSIGAKGDTVEVTPVSFGPNQAGNFSPQTLVIVGIAAVGIYLAMKK